MTTSDLRPGALFRFTALPTDGTSGFGAGKVLAVAGDIAAVALSAALWDCEPAAADVEATPYALDHLPVPVARLTDVTWLGHREVHPDELGDNHRLWLEGSQRAALDAPLPVILAGLLAG